MRKSMRTAAATFAAVTAVGMLTGCGSKAGSPAGTQMADEEKRTLRVAMEYVYAPYSWTRPDDSNGAVPIAESSKYTYGYDVTTAEKVSEELGCDLEIVRLDWDSLVPAIQADKVDCVIADQPVIPERLEAVDFNEPYHYATIVILAKEGSKYTDAKSVTNLIEATCTSQQSTIWYDICLPQIADVNILAATVDTPGMLMPSQADKCDLVVMDQPIGKGALVAYLNFKLLEFGDAENDLQVTDEETNIGTSMKKGNTELRAAIDGVLDKMAEDGFSKMMDDATAVQPLAS